MPAQPTPSVEGPAVGPRYKWTALTNTTAGSFMAMMDGSIVIIAMPAIFRGLGLDPLSPANIGYLLWMILGYRLVQAVLVVTVGRLGDQFGRVRIYNAGFAVFAASSLLLSLDPFTGGQGAEWLIAWRFVQAFGGSMLTANSAAILTDAFPRNQRGLALGINQMAGLSAMFIGLVAGGVLATIDWRAVFWINVPVGVFGATWAYLQLRETSQKTGGPIDWLGNVTFALGLGGVLIAVTYGIQPYGGHAMGWTSPYVLGLLIGGILTLGIFVVVEARSAAPMIQLSLFRIRAFTAGNVAGLVTAMARGGLQFMLIIWLQGIWLPLHGYPYSATPLWAGIFMLPLTSGFLIAGPLSGRLSDRFGARGFATVGACIFGAQLHRADDAAGRFPLRAVRLLHLRQRDRKRHVRVAQHGLDHEQRPGQPARCRGGHARNLPEFRDGPFRRRLLLSPDRRPRRQPADHAHRGPRTAGRQLRGRAASG